MAETSRHKAVHKFEVGEDDDLVTSFAFSHMLGDEDVQVLMRNRHGKPLPGTTYIVQDGNLVICANPSGWSNGDKIVVIA